MCAAETANRLYPVVKPVRRLRSAAQHAEALCRDLRLLAANPSQSAERWEAPLPELQRLHDALVYEAGDAQDDVSAPAPDQRRAFGALLRDRRGAAGLSRAKLGKLAKLSDATIKYIETGKFPASRPTLIRLVRVERLHLSWAEVQEYFGPLPSPLEPAEATSPVAPPPSDGSLNCYLPSGTIARRRQELDRLLRGPGGYVPHHALYVDECSAVDYLEYVARSPEVLELRAALPLPELVKALALHLDRNGLGGCHLIALGPGDGLTEARLACLLADAMPECVLEISLVDFSPPLLQTAYTQIAGLLEARRGVRITSALVDFLTLSTHPHLLRTTGERRRVFTLLGGSFDELERPLAFLQYGLAESLPGDLLVLDVRTPAAPRGSIETGLAREPWLSAPLPALLQTWLTGPLRRAGREALEVGLAVQPESGALPGSYTLNVRADVRTKGPRPRRFSVYRQTRYDPERLAESLTAAGWCPRVRLPYGTTHRGCLLLCEHRPLSLRDTPTQTWRTSAPSESPTLPASDPLEPLALSCSAL